MIAQKWASHCIWEHDESANRAVPGELFLLNRKLLRICKAFLQLLNITLAYY